MREFLLGAPALGFLAFAIVIACATVWASPISRRRLVNLFLLYTLGMSFGAGLLQKERWPFSTWPLVAGIHPNYADISRLLVLDRAGVEHDIDYRAFRPLIIEELIAFAQRRMLTLDVATRNQISEYLLQQVEQRAQRVRDGDPDWNGGRLYGPLSAPSFLLHPSLWKSPSDVPATPFTGLRLYSERWNLEERLRDRSALQRRVLFEYRTAVMALLSRALAFWNRFWFAPGSPLNLAAARVIFAAHALWILGSRDLAATSRLPAAFWAGVPAGDRWRYFLVPELQPADAMLQWLAVATLIAAIIGIWPRVACLVSAILLYHLAPLETIYWTPDPFERGFTVSVLALAVLGASPSGDRLVITRSDPVVPDVHGEYRWPLVLVQLFLCQVYFFAGYSKIFRAGFGWIDADNMRNWLLVFGQLDQVATVSSLTLWVANQPILCWIIAIATVVVDLAFISVLLWPRLRWWLIGTALSFHVGIAILMGIAFLNVPQLLIFVDWDRWATRKAFRASHQASRDGAAATAPEPAAIAT